MYYPLANAVSSTRAGDAFRTKLKINVRLPTWIGARRCTIRREYDAGFGRGG
jgi:hypothetical protein